ncbi:MAG: hypothetical protein NTZ16_10555 [Verrucomicrobia bacterium]|nr:hypothetical protein [Verrucomicrobiota bacterium]
MAPLTSWLGSKYLSAMRLNELKKPISTQEFICFPVCGAGGALIAAKSSGVLISVLALVFGICVGVGVVALALFFLQKLELRGALERHRWIESLFCFLLIFVLPLSTYLLSFFIVSVGLQL